MTSAGGAAAIKGSVTGTAAAAPITLGGLSLHDDSSVRRWVEALKMATAANEHRPALLLLELLPLIAGYAAHPPSQRYVLLYPKTSDPEEMKNPKDIACVRTPAHLTPPLAYGDKPGGIFLIVCDRSGSRIRRIDITTGAILPEPNTSSGTVVAGQHARGLCLDNRDGSLLFTEPHTVRRFRNGVTTTVAGSLAASGTQDSDPNDPSKPVFYFPCGILQSSDGSTLYSKSAPPACPRNP